MSRDWTRGRRGTHHNRCLSITALLLSILCLSATVSACTPAATSSAPNSRDVEAVAKDAAKETAQAAIEISGAEMASLEARELTEVEFRNSLSSGTDPALVDKVMKEIVEKDPVAYFEVRANTTAGSAMPFPVVVFDSALGLNARVVRYSELVPK